MVQALNPYLTNPGLQPHDLVLGHGDLWVLERVVRQRPPGFDARSGTWALGKFPWFRVNVGTLTVRAHRVDGPGTFHATLPPDGSYPRGFMPSSLGFSTGGCWKVTAKLHRTTITFFIAFSSSPSALCASLAQQLQELATFSSPGNQGMAQGLRAAADARRCP
jgi:hypothetical protein